MDIGKKQRVIIVEPLKEPAFTETPKEPAPQKAPTPVRTPAAPATVPASQGS